MNTALQHANYTAMLRSHLKAGQLRAFNQLHAAARKTIPDFRLDCRGIDLHQRDLTGIDLQNTDLTDANLSGAILDNANLTNADLSFATLKDTSLKRSILYCTRAEHADFSSAQLPGADMEGMFAKQARFCSANLHGARLHRAYLIGSDATSADFTRAQMRETLFSFINASGLILEGAQLADADLRGTDLTQARIQGAQMTYTLFSTYDEILAARKAGAIIKEDRTYTNQEIANHNANSTWPKSKERYDPIDRDQFPAYSQKEWHEKLSELATYFSATQSIHEPPIIQDGELLYPETGIRIRAAHAACEPQMKKFAWLEKRYPELAPLRATPTLPALNRWLAKLETHLNGKDTLSSRRPLYLFFGSGLLFEPLETHAHDPHTRTSIDILAAQCQATLDTHALDPTKAYEGLHIDPQTATPVLTQEAFDCLSYLANATRPIRPNITAAKYPSLRDPSDPLPPRLGERLENKAGVRTTESERVR